MSVVPCDGQMPHPGCIPGSHPAFLWLVPDLKGTLKRFLLCVSEWNWLMQYVIDIQTVIWQANHYPNRNIIWSVNATNDWLTMPLPSCHWFSGLQLSMLLASNTPLLNHNPLGFMWYANDCKLGIWLKKQNLTSIMQNLEAPRRIIVFCIKWLKSNKLNSKFTLKYFFSTAYEK